MHISYQLTFVPKSRKNTLRIECLPDSLVHFYSWLKPIKDNATDILFVRCDVAFDIPLHISELLEKAWIAISEFLISGEKTDLINWINSEDMPEDGNW
ncbi:hypothetical protein D3C76_1548540 [compost metagenome]